MIFSFVHFTQASNSGAWLRRHVLHSENEHLVSTPEKTARFKSPWSSVLLRTLSLWLILFVAELLLSVYLCGGRLIFTLDDPYIHLAVADHIRSGGYGVNASELSSPSSSIIWPYLLVLTEALHLGAVGPLLIDAFAAAATVVIFLRTLEAEGLLEHQRNRFASAAVAVLVIAATSSLALPMTGMEHSLHVWATIVTFAGLVEAARGRPPTAVHFVALISLVLLRFEGAAFAMASMMAFALLGQRRFAAWAFTVTSSLVGIYAALMAYRGLPLVPSSVLLKSRLAEAAYEGSNTLGLLCYNLEASLRNPFGRWLAVLGLAIVFGTWLLRADRRVVIVCGAVIVAVGAHLFAGRYDWFHRYEVYVFALASLALLYIVAHLRWVLSSRQWAAARIGAIFLVGFGGTPYVSAAIETPLASRGIYDQQYQMGIFAKQLYQRPVAVNDLGLVAYKNPEFVLDLWGLGSEKVRKARLAGQYGPSEMATLAHEYQIGVVMIYERWFPKGLPTSWKKIAVLHTQSLTAAERDVAIYKTPDANDEEITRALRNFEAVLPLRDRLEVIK